MSQFSLFSLALLSIVSVVASAFYSAPTYDETGHMVAGQSHWQFSRFELYRVNPPLARLIQTLPLVFVPHEVDWSGYDVKSPTRQEFSVGRRFIASNRMRSTNLFAIARLSGLSFAVLGAWMCFLLGRRLYGREAGCAACCLWCVSPTVLGHAPLITPDVPAASMGLVAIYRILRWLERSDWPNTCAVGLAVACAMATKSTWLLLAPIVVALAAWRVTAHAVRALKVGRLRSEGSSALTAKPEHFVSNSENRRLKLRRSSRVDMSKDSSCFRQVARQHVLQVLAIGMICFVVLNSLYVFHGFLKPLGSFSFRSRVLAGENSNALNLGNRFKDSWVGKVPSPLPEDYILGIDRQKMEFEWNKRAYLGGRWQDGGWWYYYLYAAAVKIPVAYLVLIFLALFSFCLSKAVHPDEWVVLGVAVLVFCFVSSQTGINKHFRYVLPALPMIFVFSGRLWKSGDRSEKCNAIISEQPHALSRLESRELAGSARWDDSEPKGRRFVSKNGSSRNVALWILLWLGAAESLIRVPHSMSFFNLLAGGPQNGRFHLLNSNVSWGQDIQGLIEWQQEMPIERNHLFAALHANYDPSDLGLKYSLAPQEVEDNGVKSPEPGLYAIDVNFLMGYPYTLAAGDGHHTATRPEFWMQFQQLEPVDQIGYSIFIYQVHSGNTDFD